MNKKRRIFIGYLISKELQQIIVDWQREFLNLSVRWTTPKNLHITLLPPWYEEEVERVIEKLQKAQKRISPFTVTFDAVAIGPDEKKPRLMWAKGSSPEELTELKRNLSFDLKKDLEKRNSLMHITLARFDQEYASQIRKEKFPQNISWFEDISTISVLESHLQKKGSDYEPLATISLA